MYCVGLLLFFIIVRIHAQSATQYESCYTPARTPGQCISIRNCPELIQLLQRRPLTSSTAAYLKSAHCGFDGLDAKVCCSFSSDQTTSRSTNTNKNVNTNINIKPNINVNKNTNTNIETNRKPGFPVVKPQTDPPVSSLLPSKLECGLSTGSDKIVGGLPADLFDFPWMCLIEYKRPVGTGFYCGGSLITKKYVLTAAHCVKGEKIPYNFQIKSVRLGEYDLDTDEDCIKTREYSTCSDPPIDVPVVEILPHENYDPYDVNQYNDIALLRLAREVVFTDFIKPICLPMYHDVIRQLFAGINATVSGWGKTEEAGTGSSIKLKVNVPVKSNRQCEGVYESTRVTLSNTQMCAGGDNGKDSCGGDSGGPLMYMYTSPGEINWYITGIVSFGPTKCGLNGWPGIYTRVTEYIPWILQNIKS